MKFSVAARTRAEDGALLRDPFGAAAVAVVVVVVVAAVAGLAVCGFACVPGCGCVMDGLDGCASVRGMPVRMRSIARGQSICGVGRGHCVSGVFGCRDRAVLCSRDF